MRLQLLAGAALGALLAVAYANHFNNGFHFDDDHTIVNNVWVRDISNIPRFFVDATTSSVLPLNRSYRPVLQATLAIDYRNGGGYSPRAFQIDTFAWFVLQLICLWWLFARLAVLSGGTRSIALVPTAVYGLHPACAETINYIIQRGDVISTCGVVAALALYAEIPRWRRSLLYLIPLVVGVLAKPPAFVFPILLFAYISLIERKTVRQASVATIPSVLLVALLAGWSVHQTPPTFTTGGGSAPWYWLTQTFVALRYGLAFFAPIELSADNDWHLLTTVLDGRALLGVMFIGALFAAIAYTSVRGTMRPVAFGLVWFLAALIPTSIVPLAEVGNDHRMFFPFVGLALAVSWPAYMWWRDQRRPGVRAAAIAGLVLVLVLEAVGVRERNSVWRTDESLWYDVTLKSPTNGRGLMNYGLARMEQGDFPTALTYFERAAVFAPAYSLLHINLGIAYGQVGRAGDAEREFAEAIRLAPGDWRSHFYYGRWLREIGRTSEAVTQLEIAATANPADLVAASELKAARAAVSATGVSPEVLLQRSLAQYQSGQYRDCIATAKMALTLRPNYAEAYNNIAAAYNALGDWDDGIAAAREAVRLNPALVIAQNNLLYAQQQKARGSR